MNKFINELSPTFAPAISRVRRLLDTWNPYDNTTPEVLKITALPNTIERFMAEELGQQGSHIRKINTPNRNKMRPPPQQKSDVAVEQADSMDVYCHFCGEYGHPPTKCHFMAKLMKASASSDKVDSKTKKEAQESFKQKQRQKRERRLKRKTALVHKLLDSGGSRDDIAAVLDSMQDDSEDEARLQDHADDDSEAESTSSSK